MEDIIPHLPSDKRGEWEPIQDSYSLQLGYPGFQLRALAQIFVNTVPLATLWLTYSDDYRISLVEPYTPNSTSSVYLPYLYTYALIITGGIIPTPVTNMQGVYDITAAPFNGQGNYVNAGDHGYDNASAIDAAILAASQAGGGIVLIPGGKFYTSKRHRIPRNGVKIMGLGRKISYIYHEPTDYDGTGLFRFDADTSYPNQSTTIDGVAVLRLSIRGDNPDEMSVSAQNARPRRIAVQGVCTSGLELDFDLLQWNTGSTNYGSQGPSHAYLSQGKELTYHNGFGAAAWYTDQPVRFMANPKEPGNQIDADGYKFENTYWLGKYLGTEFIVQIDAGLNFIRNKWTGRSIWALGGGGMNLVEEIGTGLNDCSDLVIEGICMEQMTAGSGGAGLRLQKKGGQKFVGLQIKDCLLDTAISGLELNGVKFSSVEDGGYWRYSSQGSSPKGITLSGTIKNLKIESFLIPSITSGGASLLSLGGATITTGIADKVTSGTEGNQLDSLASYNL